MWLGDPVVIFQLTEKDFERDLTTIVDDEVTASVFP